MTGIERPKFAVYMRQAGTERPWRMVADCEAFLADNKDGLDADEYEALCDLMVAAQHGNAEPEDSVLIGGGASPSCVVYIASE